MLMLPWWLVAPVGVLLMAWGVASVVSIAVLWSALNDDARRRAMEADQ